MKNNTLSFIIPGLSMSSVEFAEITNCIILENFEIGTNTRETKEAYTLEDQAKEHVEEILKNIEEHRPDKIRIMGMSMGGMILSCIASAHADKLPANTEFYFLVTSPNNEQAETIPNIVVQKWMTIDPENEDSVRKATLPFFSEQFLNNYPEKVEQYCKYRFERKNLQSPHAFMKQMAALRSFKAENYFKAIPQERCIFIGGGSDYVLGKRHTNELMRICPEAQHMVIENLGHMINIEAPRVVQDIIDGKLQDNY